MKLPKKLNKDQLQKIILSTLGFVGLIYCYFNFFLWPLERSRALMTQTIADLQAKTGSSKTEMKKTANLEAQAKAATTRYGALKATTAEGAPIAWFPPKMRSFFATRELDRAVVRLDGQSDFKEPELSDWTKDAWAIDLPETDYNALGNALAELENTEPLLAVGKITIHATPDNPQLQIASLRVETTLYRK